MCIRVKSCCGCNSLEQGAKVIAILGLIMGGISFGSGVIKLDVKAVVGAALEIAVSAMLFHGVKMRKSAFVMAWLVISMIQIVVAILVSVALMASTEFVESNWDEINKALGGEINEDEGKDILKIMLWIGAAVILVFSALNMYFWIVVYSFHKELQTDAGEVVRLESGECQNEELLRKTKQ